MKISSRLCFSLSWALGLLFSGCGPTDEAPAPHATEPGFATELAFPGQQGKVVRGIVAQANVERAHGDVVRNAAGTTVGEVTVNGETREFPDTDVLEIPGVARLERHIVRRTPNGIQVTALRVTLLDGSGAVLDLGQARLTIRGSGF